jgi:hypothetical protein
MSKSTLIARPETRKLALDAAINSEFPGFAYSKKRASVLDPESNRGRKAWEAERQVRIAKIKALGGAV